MYYLFGFIMLGIMYYYFFKLCTLIKEKLFDLKCSRRYIDLCKKK